MNHTITGVELGGLASSWLANPHVKERLLDECTPEGLIRAPEGERTPIAVQETALVNEMFIAPIIIQMRMAHSLQIPHVDPLKDELRALWWKYFQAKEKRKAKGRSPNLAPDFVLPDLIEATIHTDAKSLKTLLSMVKKQFTSTRVAKEPWHNSNVKHPVKTHTPGGPIPSKISEDEDYRRLVNVFGNKAGHGCLWVCTATYTARGGGEVWSRMQVLYPELDPVPGEQAPRALGDDERDDEEDKADSEGSCHSQATTLDMRARAEEEGLPQALETIAETPTNQETIAETPTNQETIAETPLHPDAETPLHPEKATAAKSKAQKITKQVWEDDDPDDCIMDDPHDAVASRRALLEAELQRVKLAC